MIRANAYRILSTLWLLPILMVLGTTVAAADSAEYSVTFDASWSAATHPSDIPSVPHFSKLVGGGIRLSLGSVSTTFSITSTHPSSPWSR